MKRYKAYLFDLDGTLYRGSQALPYAADVVARLRADGCFIRFLTNNSGTTPESVAHKLNGMSISAEPGEVVTSGMAAARYLKLHGMERLFVVGEPGLVQVLRREGLTVANADLEGRVQPEEEGPYHAVVCGICRNFSYWLLNAAFQAIRAGAPFIATNPDTTYPMEEGRLEPGAGSLVAALQTCSGVKPYIAGKPRPDMIEMVLAETGLKSEKVMVVGDRIDTDIEAANAAGCASVLVLSGVSSALPGIESIHGLDELLN